ncbi:MAG TPA: hypothetical protein VD905_02695 [Flavobacteriales bacterium]|nr:hypothetical protein [Flavobacteriales bacterium]
MAETVAVFLLQTRLGGHANDGDEFQVAFTFSGKPDLENKFTQLGLTVPDREQPGHVTIAGHKTFMWVTMVQCTLPYQKQLMAITMK